MNKNINGVHMNTDLINTNLKNNNPDEKITTESHTIFQPDYYDDFSCLADACPDTCCQGWIIEIDPETYNKWKDVIPSEYIRNTPLRHGDVRHEICMTDKMTCPLLTENGLCSVVMAHGHAMTARICQDYPRNFNEVDGMMQKHVSVRCSAVLDLLWKKDSFSYIEASGDGKTVFPARNLLDGLLSIGNDPSVSSAQFLSAIFHALYDQHRELEALVPVDENGLRDYGMEMITEENSDQVLENTWQLLSALAAPSEQKLMEQDRYHSLINLTGKKIVSKPQKNSSLAEVKEVLQSCHSYMYDVMLNFFDSPVFGLDFQQRFQQSSTFLTNLSEKAALLWKSGRYLSADMDRKLKLVLLEELFASVCSIDVADYETVLVRLQWLVVQFLVLRYLIFMDYVDGKEMDMETLRHSITWIFRVTELPDIMRIAFFDHGFVNWLWEPAYVDHLLMGL